MFKFFIATTLLVSSLTAVAQEKLLCLSDSFGAEFTLRYEQDPENFGLIQDSFNAVHVVGMEGDEPVYGDRELWVNMAYLMRLPENEGKFDFIGSVVFADSSIYPVMHFRADQVGDDTTLFAGTVTTVTGVPYQFPTDESLVCTKRFSGPDSL